MLVGLILLLPCLCGLILFQKNQLQRDFKVDEKIRISVIIPARNEEKNLPNLLQSLKSQTMQPHEIIVCDDHSTDATSEIARSFGVTIIQNPELPENWTGKNWAVWNGYLKSSGEVLIFLDADVTLDEGAVEALQSTRAKAGGAISVVPFHRANRFYERLSLVPYLLGVLTFMSPFERNNNNKGLYGSCIVATRSDYEKINGHSSVSGELLDDLNLGKKFVSAGINVRNYIGHEYVSFRMYPNGIMSEVYGFGKGAVLSTSNILPTTLAFIALWLVGLIACGIGAPILILLGYKYALAFVVGYILYVFQLRYILRYTGKYGVIIPFLHPLSSIFFIFIMLYSLYRVTFVGSVKWKGRVINVRRKSA